MEVQVDPGFPLTLDVQPSGQMQIFGWGGSTDSSTAKLDSNGAVLWSQHFDSSEFTLNVPIDQIVDGSGNVYVVCNDNGLASAISQIALLKYASDGTPLWTAVVPGIDVGSAWATQLVLDSHGQVIVAATILTNDQSDFFTLKFDGNGVLLWSASYDGERNEVEPIVAVDATDNVHIAGRTFDPRTGLSDIVVIKYNSDGQQLWLTRYDGPSRRNEYPVAIRIDAAGNVYAGGYADTDPALGYSLQLEALKFSPNGQLLWAANYSRAPAEYLQATDVALDGSGNLLLAGHAYSHALTSGDAVLVKFSPAGERLWAARYNGPRNGSELGRALAMDSAGNAYLTGDSQDGPDPNNPTATSYFTQKFDPSGNRVWNITRSGEVWAYNYPVDIGLDASGGVYIAGRTNNTRLAIKYVQTTAPGLPSILSAPTNQIVRPRTMAAFSVTATGNAPLSYQWRYNGRVISGATNATLTLNNVQFAQRGSYSVDVSNSVGTIATAEAELVVLEPPTISRPPASQTVFAGTEATFTLSVDGLAPFTYQWQHNNSPLSAATNAALVLLNVQPANAGGYSVVVGNAAGSVTSQVAVLTVSTQVMRSWAIRYDGTPQGTELNPLLALDGAGLPVVTTTSLGVGTDFDFATFKHDLSGVRLWTSRFDSVSSHADYAAALFTDTGGNVYVAGHSLGIDQPALIVVKYDPDGELLWSMATNHQWRTEAPCVITADGAGNAYVAAGDGFQQVVTFKFDPAGQLVWATNFTDAEYDKRPRAIAVDPAGNVCLGIRQDYYCCTDFLLVKYAPDGRELWRAAYDGRENEADVADTLFGMGLDAAGNIYLAGQVFGHFVEDGTELELGVVKLDGNGGLVWDVRHRIGRPTVPVAFAVNSAGGSWLAYAASPPQGETQSYYASNRFSAVVHFGPDGQERWASVVIGGNRGSLNALTADAAGNTYLAGAVLREDASSDLTTSRLDPNGNLLWTALYNGPANGADHANAIAVGPTRDIFVAGTSGNKNGVPDVVLLKYRDNPLPGLPTITTLPRRIVTRIGSNVTFTVGATGTAPLRYQWFFNGIPMPGSTSSSLTLRGLRQDQAGFYAVEVSNPSGTVRSPATRLEILSMPEFGLQPLDQNSVIGADAYFTVQAGGDGPLAYQWLLNGVPIAGATNTTLILENLQVAQAGNYSVVIRDAAGAVSSRSARLTISLAAAKCEQWDYVTPEPNSILNTLIARDSAGNFYVAGAAWLTNEADFLVLKYSSTGQLLWQASHDFAGGRDLTTAIAVDPMGNVIVTGVSYPVTGPGFTGDYATVKYDSQGNKLWARSYVGPVSHDSATAVAADQNGSVYVTGFSQRGDGTASLTAYLTVKYGPDGTQLWTTEYQGPASQYASAHAIVVDAAGDIYVTGVSYGETGQGNIATIKYSPSGNEVWVRRWEQVPGGGTGLALDNAGHLIVVGYSLTSLGSGLVTIKYDIHGNERWFAHYRNPAGGVAIFRAATVDGSGNVLVTGESNGDVATLKYDTNGHQLWVALYDGLLSGNDSVRDLAMDTAGNAYITGFSQGLEPGYTDLITIKYDTAGTRLWLAREVGSLNGVPGSALVLDASANVYVAGAFAHGLATLKYCQNDVPGGPVIHEPPQPQDAVVGTNVTLSVVASGANPLGYQWRFNGQIIPGATNSALSLSNVQLSDAGNYNVEVFNLLGSVVSADAALRVHVPASILTPPADQCIVAGSIALFHVVASGELPIRYQWSFGGQDIPGATNATLHVSNVLPSQVGIYTVRASNPFGSATASASLTVVPNVQQLWARIFNTTNRPPFSDFASDDWPTKSALDAEGNLYIAGLTSIPVPLGPNPRNIFIVKYDTNGTLQWVAHHGTTSLAIRQPTGIAVNAAGEVHLAVEDYTDTNAPALLKYSASGQLLWTARFPGAEHPTARDLALDSAGNAYVIETLFRVMKVSPAGTRLWTAVRPQALAHDLTVDDIGNVYVAGAAFAPSGPQPSDRGLDYLTVKYNTAGAEQWSRTFRGPLGLENAAYAIAVDNAGNVVVAGSYVVHVNYTGNLNSRLNFGTFKYDRNGNVVWFADYGETNNVADFPAAMALDAGGNVIITGFSENFEGNGPHWVTLKYGAGGGLEWARGVTAGLWTGNPPSGLAIDTAGNAYVSGTLWDENSQRAITTVKYGLTGAEDWRAQFDASTVFEINYGSFAVGVHADTSGRVLVTGTISTHGHDVVALAYSQQPSPDAPVIVSQPQNVSVIYGSPAQFSVTASNALRFQWQFNGRELPDATNTTLIVTADLDREGRYEVLVENDTYCVVSRAAHLALIVPTPVLINPYVYEHYFYCTAVVTPGRSYRLEGSSDLMNWTLVSQQPAYGRTINFNDDASPWQAWRFYRVVQEP